MQPNTPTKSPAEIVARMTPRQKEIFSLLTQGFTNKEIAAQLGIAHVTVKRHQRDVSNRLGIDSRMVLICAMAICQHEQSKESRENVHPLGVTRIGTFE